MRMKGSIAEMLRALPERVRVQLSSLWRRRTLTHQLVAAGPPLICVVRFTEVGGGPKFVYMMAKKCKFPNFDDSDVSEDGGAKGDYKAEPSSSSTTFRRLCVYISIAYCFVLSSLYKDWTGREWCS